MKTNSEKSITVFYHKYAPGLFMLPLNTNTRNVPKAVWFRLQLQTLIQKLNKLKPSCTNQNSLVSKNFVTPLSRQNCTTIRPYYY